eukprot:83717-Prorocentrum_minimum.AAC.1
MGTRCWRAAAVGRVHIRVSSVIFILAAPPPFRQGSRTAVGWRGCEPTSNGRGEGGGRLWILKGLTRTCGGRKYSGGELNSPEVKGHLKGSKTLNGPLSTHSTKPAPPLCTVRLDSRSVVGTEALFGV